MFSEHAFVCLYICTNTSCTIVHSRPPPFFLSMLGGFDNGVCILSYFFTGFAVPAADYGTTTGVSGAIDIGKKRLLLKGKEREFSLVCITKYSILIGLRLVGLHLYGHLVIFFFISGLQIWSLCWCLRF